MAVFVDSHVHIMTPWRLKALARWILKAYPDHPVSPEITRHSVLDDLHRCGVTHFFNFIYPLTVEETEPLNDFNRDFCSQTRGAIPFASMHPDTPSKAEYAGHLLKQNCFAGFKFHPFVQRFDPWDSRMDPLYEFLQEHQFPVVLHTGFEQFYGQKMPFDQLAGLVARYPGLPLVFVHMAFPEFPACFELMGTYPELYMDATNVFAFLRPAFSELVNSLPGGYRLMDTLFEGIEQYSHRTMYGSDHPVGMGSLQEIYDDLKNCPLSRETRAKLSGETPVAFINRFLPDYKW